ncbi:MAG: STAS-like domain-containing protein [Nitrospirae bacterium]|nr:STAS-like domain-containing protein [Nitrospirota bacterium]
MKVDVFKVTGENCITLEDGHKIFDMIHPELSAGRVVELDFENVKIFASPFFNSAIGRLLKDFKSEDLNRLLKITNLTPTGMSVLKRVIENAKEYYSNPEMRKAVDDVLLEQSQNL